MIKRQQTTIKKNTIVSASNSWVPPNDLGEKNITFAFMISDNYAEVAYEMPWHG